VKRGRTTLVAAAVLASALASASVCYYWSAWQVAQAAAIAIVAGDEIPSFGPADPTYRLQLGSPARDTVEVSTDPGWLALSRSLPFNFTVRNTKSLSIPAVQFGVDVELTPRGWVVIGYGSGG